MNPLEEMGKFATVVIDPPWPVDFDLDLSRCPNGDGYAPAGFVNHSPVPYQTMSLESLAALPIDDVITTNGFVFCWTTRRFLPHTFPLMEAWGLTYRFTMVWHKPDGPQLPQFPAECGVCNREREG